MRSRSAAWLVAGLLPLLGGCLLIPEYRRPSVPVPTTWGSASPAATLRPDAAPPEQDGTRDPGPLPDWEAYFTDERLRAVIALALESNLDLRVAALNIERSAALLRIQRSELYPAVTVEGSAERYRLPDRASPTSETQTLEQGIAAAAVSWELDFFGRVRSLSAAALEQYLASEEGHAAAVDALIAGTARAWLALGSDLENVRIAQETYTSQKESLELIRARADGGMGSLLDVHQAQSVVDAAWVDLERFTGQAAVSRNALELLVGAPVDARLLPTMLHEVTPEEPLAPGIPSEVLLARPDILAAEHELKASNANIGAARAAFFPSVRLTGAAGFMSYELDKLFDDGTGAWSFRPNLSIPIFTGGRLRANLKWAKIQREIALARYEHAIQRAFAEVSDGLALRQSLLEQHRAQKHLVDSLAETHRLSSLRYETGMGGYLDVLVAQRQLLEARQGLVAVRRAEQANRVALYEALGGGA